jgi:DNA-binding CsgD family transcriptional regulator
LAEDVLRQALTSAQEAEVLLSLANMYGLSADQRAEAGLRALALPEMPELTRARHLAYLAHNRTTGGRPDEASAVLPSAWEAIARTGDTLSRFTVELVESGLRYRSGEFDLAREFAETCVRTGAGPRAPSRMVLSQYWRSEAYSVLDRYDDARRLTAANLAQAQRDHQVWGTFLFEGGRGRHLLQTGRLEDAAAALEPSVEMTETVALAGVLDAAAAAALGQVALHTGDHALLRRCLTVLESLRASGTPAVSAHASWLAALASSDPVEAAARVRALTRVTGPGMEPRLPHDVTDEVMMVRIALAAGDTDLAGFAATAAAERAVRNPGVATIIGVAAHCRGLRDRSGRDLDEAVDALSAGPRPLALASALEDAARLADEPRAVAALDQALEIYTTCGATRDAARVRHQLRDLGVRRRPKIAPRPRRGWAGLTASELAVARLVAGGLSNREAAERLYVSVHTVGSHLRSAFRKLGINSRMELAALVAASDAAQPQSPGRAPQP